MEVLKIVITVVFIIVSIALAGLVLMQEGKSAGLGSIAGAGKYLHMKLMLAPCAEAILHSPCFALSFRP